MKKTKLFIMMVVVAAIFFAVSGKTTMAKEERSYFIVTSGTATKLGTNEVEQISNKAYLEEWQISEEISLGQKTKDTLLKAPNSNELPVKMQDVTYLTLNELASKAASKSVSGSPVYQGYGQLKIKDAKEGYTFGVFVETTNAGEKITGYYAEISGKSIYKIDLLCSKSSQSTISAMQKQSVEVEIHESTNNSEVQNTGIIEDYSSNEHHRSNSNSSTSSSSSSTSPTSPTPAPPTTPPLNPGPSIPDPVIPGATTETNSILPPSNSPITGATIPGEVVEGASY